MPPKIEAQHRICHSIPYVVGHNHHAVWFCPKCRGIISLKDVQWVKNGFIIENQHKVE